MKNIKNYEDFVNEEINLDKYKTNLKYYSINNSKFFLINILVPILIIVRIFWKQLRKNRSIDDIIYLTKHGNKSVRILNSLIHKDVLNIDKMEEKDIITLFHEIRKKYNKKYKNRDFDEDVKNILHNWGTGYGEKITDIELLVKHYLDLSRKDDISNRYLDVDPYKEDDWEDEIVKEFIPSDIFDNFNDFMTRIRNLIVGKTIIFEQVQKRTNQQQQFKKKIKVSRVNFVFGRHRKMIIIDNDHKTYDVNIFEKIKILD